MYLYGTVRSYAEEASSGQPTPGGGSVAALAGALGMTMGCMAANFTVGKKKFKAVEPEVQQLLAACLRARAVDIAISPRVAEDGGAGNESTSVG